MKKKAYIYEKIKNFNKKISVPGDKSLSIRFVLLASQALGKSTAYNILKSEDVICALNSIKKLGIKYKLTKNYCMIYGKGLNGFKYKNNTVINAGNSGTLSRLIIGLLINSQNTIILKGDKSLSKRDFSRVTKPLKNFGLNDSDLELKFQAASELGLKSPASLRDIINHLENTYCRSSLERGR